MALPRARSDILPEIAISKRVTGTGFLRRSGVEVPIAAFTLERQAYQTDQAWKLVTHAANEHWKHWDNLTREPAPPLEFEGRTDDGEDIRISSVHWRHQSAGKLEADVWEVRYELRPPIVVDPPTMQYVSIHLTTTPLALPEHDYLSRSFTGMLAPIPGDEDPTREAVIIPLKVGAARFSLTFSWEDVRLAGLRCAVRVPHANLRFEVTADARNANQYALIDRVAEETDDALSVLSFLSRRFVRWTGIYCTSVWKSESARYISEAAVERTVAGSKPTERRAPIVNARRMKPSALGGLVAKYSGITQKESIASAITYGIYVEDAPTVETSFTSAFTCFETLVSGLDESRPNGKLLSDGKFRTVRNRVRGELERIGEDADWDPAILGAMIRKIPELQRAPIVDRAVALLTKTGVVWRDLWPAQTDLTEGLTAAFRRRNLFLHAGAAPDGLLARADSLRLRFLSERLLFNLIGGSDEWFDHNSFEDVRWVATINEGSEQKVKPVT